MIRVADLRISESMVSALQLLSTHNDSSRRAALRNDLIIVITSAMIITLYNFFLHTSYVMSLVSVLALCYIDIDRSIP
jgi:hypothetical protein